MKVHIMILRTGDERGMRKLSTELKNKVTAQCNSRDDPRNTDNPSAHGNLAVYGNKTISKSFLSKNRIESSKRLQN